ncbi:amino acid adenylation domain-containing protein [Gordonia sp. ABSL49_1]|uniref:amino acid adenylation domain-containing protein n=1 Tax=Gordonia sp. ABSL49_1 TaxID=2920941 RepID=UPI001F0D11DD|nr:amino acid adenylation domain-containing protein [Gordonia sp. ABSL49_1]MCH5644751.1 amino acid adenylation domain-containing protein [Gordonia sp. ABSL49_1]
MTLARRALWLAQLLRPDVSYVIAFGVTMAGPLDVSRLIDAAGDVLDHVGWRDIHIPAACSPADPSCLDPFRPGRTGCAAVDLVDLSANPDPRLDSDRRAAAFISSPAGSDLDAPLWRSELHRLGPDRHRWIVRVHHVLTDGAGALRVMRHIGDVYRSGALPADLVVTSDADLVSAEQAYLDSPRHRTDAVYWEEMLDRHEPSLMTGGSPEPTSDITRITRPLCGIRRSSSTEAVSAIATFCARMLDTPDVGLALPVAARTSRLRRDAVQPLSNVVPLTLEGIGDATAAGALEQLETAVVGALRHQLYRREEMLNTRDDLTDFGAVVNLLPTVSLPTVDGVHWHVEVLRTGPVTDLAVTLHPDDDDGRGAITWEAPASSVHTEELTRWATRFQRYLDATLDELDNGKPVPDGAVFLSGETERFRCRSGPPAPRFSTTAALLDDYRATDPDAEAVIDGELSLSRAELVRWADRGARMLTDAGVTPGDPVAVCIERSAASVVAFWSVMRAGAVWVPVGDQFSPEGRTVEIIERTNAKVGLCAPGKPGPPVVRWVETGPTAAGRPTDLPGQQDDWWPPGLSRGPDDRAYILFTSGSTGHPKGVDMPHRGIPALVAEIRESYALDADARMLHASSPTFDTGIVELLSAVATGAALVVAPVAAHSGDRLAEVIEAHRVTHIIVTPSVLDTLPIDLADRLRQVVLGGEPVGPRLVAHWGNRVPLRTAYGPTETRCSINFSGPLRPGRPLTVGPPMIGVTEAILDRHGRAQPPGALGILYCAGPQVADGYLDAPDLTAEVFGDCTFADDARMYRTGDLATWTPDGEVRILGRRDQQVKLRGLRIELGEVDAALGDAAGVRTSATLLRETFGGRTGLVSFVVLDEGSVASAAELRRQLAIRLPTYMIPSAIVFLDELPRTANDKLDVRALKSHALPGPGQVRGPTGPAEALVLRVLGEVLGNVTIDPDASFVENGGDSLAVVRAAHLFAAAGHPEIGPGDVLAATSPADIAASMTMSDNLDIPPALPATGNDDAARRLAPAELTVSRTPGDPGAQLMRFAWVPEPGSAPSVGDVRAMVGTLLDRHPALRSTYPDVPGGAIQLVGQARPEESVISVHAIAPDRNALGSLADRLAARLDVRKSPPVGVAVVTDDDTVRAVVVVVHHVAVDGHSLAILASDAAALSRGQPLTPAPTRSPGESRHDARDHRFWIDHLGREPDSSWTLAGISPTTVAPGRAVRRSALVTAQTFRRFQSRAARLGMTPFEAFRTVVATALADTTGDRRVISATPHSIRPADDEGVVGNYVLSALLPLDADIAPRRAAEMAREYRAAATLPAETVLDLIGHPAVAESLFPVPVLVGWSPPIAATMPAGRAYVFGPSYTRWMLQIQGEPHPTGELGVRVTGCREVFGDDRAESLLRAVLGGLEAS